MEGVFFVLFCILLGLEGGWRPAFCEEMIEDIRSGLWNVRFLEITKVYFFISCVLKKIEGFKSVVKHW